MKSDPNPTTAQAIRELTEVSPSVLERLYQNHVIDEQGYRYASEAFLPQQQWRRWIMRLSLGLGTALLLLGIVFFFAYNWHDMPKWSKLALLEGAMVASFVLAIIVGLKKLLGQCLLLAGTVFIGVFFAVFGQIYQTGADAWQLFALWSVLMLGFVWLSHFSIQWILQWSITGVALFLWLQQYDNEWGLGLVMAAYTLGIWGLQRLLSKSCQWLNIRWLRVLTLFIGHIWLLITAVIVLINDDLVVLFAVMAIGAILLWWHWQKGVDLLSQVIGVGMLAILTWALFLYFFIKSKIDEVSMVSLMLSLTIILSVGCYQAVIVLKKQYANKHVGSANHQVKGGNHE